MNWHEFQWSLGRLQGRYGLLLNVKSLDAEGAVTAYTAVPDAESWSLDLGKNCDYLLNDTVAPTGKIVEDGCVSALVRNAFE